MRDHAAFATIASGCADHLQRTPARTNTARLRLRHLEYRGPTPSKVGDTVRIREFLRRAQQTDYVMGIGSLWVVTEGMREHTYSLAAQGKPYPDPKIAHIMYEVAAAVLDRSVWQLLAYAGAGLVLLAAATVAAVTGSEPLAGGLAVLALAAAAMARHTAKTVRFWSRVYRANSSAQ